MIAYNQKQLGVIINDMYNRLSEYGSLSLSYDKPFNNKTTKQMGFFFGALCDSIRDFYREQGDIWDVNDIKENFYSAVSHIDERFLKKCRRFNGEEYVVPKRLSEMDREEVSRFIDLSVQLVDSAKCFRGLILHPSIRYTWVRHITPDEIRNIGTLPRIDTAYLEHTRKQACLWCGIANKSEAHHLKEAGFTGTAYKADDPLVIPLCHSCHRDLHTRGVDAFLNDCQWITKYMPLIDFCRVRYSRYLAELK